MTRAASTEIISQILNELAVPEQGIVALKKLLQLPLGPDQITHIQKTFSDPSIQNIFVQASLQLFATSDERTNSLDLFKKFIKILSDEQCFLLCQKLFIMQHNKNKIAVIPLATALLEKLTARHFFQNIPINNFADFADALPATDDQKLIELKEKILQQFHARILERKNQHYIRKWVDEWLKCDTTDKKRARHIENILLKINPTQLQANAKESWEQYVQKLSKKIDALSKNAANKQFSTTADAYLIMRAVERLLEMVDRQPKDKYYKKRHDQLTEMRDQLIQVNVEKKLAQLFDKQDRVSRIFHVNVGEAALDSTVYLPETQLSAYNSLLKDQCVFDDFTHIVQDNVVFDIYRFHCKFELPDGSYFYFRTKSDGSCALEQYDEQGKYQAEAFEIKNLLSLSKPQAAQQVKDMLCAIRYHGNHWPSSLIDFVAEYLLVQGSPLYYNQMAHTFLTQAIKGVNGGDAGHDRMAEVTKIMKAFATDYVIKWNGNSDLAAKLDIYDESLTKSLFTEIGIKSLQAPDMPGTVHSLQKFKDVIEVTTHDIPLDFSAAHLSSMNKLHQAEWSDDPSDQLFNDMADVAFKKIKKENVLDAQDLQAIFIKREMQLEARGFSPKKIKESIEALARKWYLELYKSPTDTRKLALDIQEQTQEFLAVDFVAENKKYVQPNNFATFYLMTSAEKKSCLTNLSEMKNVFARQQIADAALQHNEVKVVSFGILKKLKDYMISVKDSLKSSVRIYFRKALKKFGVENFRQKPIDEAIKEEERFRAEHKTEWTKKSNIFSHAFVISNREDDAVYNAEELYQLMTQASPNGIIAALEDASNQRILKQSPGVLADLYCYLKLNYKDNTDIARALDELWVSPQEFLKELHAVNPIKYDQTGIFSASGRAAGVKSLCRQGADILTDKNLLVLFLTYAKSATTEDLNRLVQQLDPVNLIACYRSLPVNLHHQFEKLMRDVFVMALRNNPSASFMQQIITVPDVKTILPELLVDLSWQWLGLERINIEKMIQAVTHGDLSCLFGENPDAFILFLQYATPAQIMTSVKEINVLLDSKFVGGISQPRRAEVLSEIINRFDGASFAGLDAVKDKLKLLLVPVKKVNSMQDSVGPHPGRPPQPFRYLHVPSAIFAAPDTKKSGDTIGPVGASRDYLPADESVKCRV